MKFVKFRMAQMYIALWGKSKNPYLVTLTKIEADGFRVKGPKAKTDPATKKLVEGPPSEKGLQDFKVQILYHNKGELSLKL